MKFEDKDAKVKYIRQSIFCVTAGTVTGFLVYQIFLYFKIAIVGWNLGLIFAPLIAGYVETILANKIIGENIGAISAFILFVYTTFYSFILKNPTLGWNLITFGAIIVILQAAFPTAVNYILLNVGLEMLLSIVGTFKKITSTLHNKAKKFVYKHILKKPIKETMIIPHEFDEVRSNNLLNNLDFYFITSTDIPDKKIINLGQFHATVIIEKVIITNSTDVKNIEKEKLDHLKTGKDQCLIKLATNIKNAGGNGVIGLDIQYSLIGIGGDSYQITALGTGIYLNDEV